MMSILSIAIIALMQMACATAGAGPGHADGLASVTPGCCNNRDYVGFAFDAATAIPDGDPNGVTIGPLVVSDNHLTLRDIILRLELSHAYMGDLRIWLHYDSNDDGIYEASTPIEIHLARLNSCANAELYSCPIELDGVYWFRDEGWRAAGEDASLASFDGLAGGGAFYLSITDGAADDTGLVESWAVCTRSAVSESLVGLARQTL
ncbi:MAG: hypothetical protein PVF43_03785 [Candidatus Eiseniibacteriota bacterium]|jgi:hypothetical protein